jgi:hypothetical protein
MSKKPLVRGWACMALAASCGLLAYAWSHPRAGPTLKGWLGMATPPRLSAPEVVDFGAQELGQTAQQRITLANSGESTLRIEGIRTSCSCSGLEIERDGKLHRLTNFEIPPLSALNLVVRVAVGGRVGVPQNHGIILRTNDPAAPEWLIQVAIPRVKGGIIPFPSSLALGRLEQGGDGAFTIVLYDDIDQRRKIARVESTNAGQAQVRYEPTVGQAVASRLGKDHVEIGRVHVRCATAKLGPVNGSILVHLEGETRPPDRIGVAGEVIGLYDVQPAELLLPFHSSRGLMSRGECLIRRRDQHPFELVLKFAPQGVKIEGLGGTAVEHRLAIDVGARNGNADRGRIELLARGAGGERAVEINLVNPLGN